MKRPSNLLCPVLALLTACAAPAEVMGANLPERPLRPTRPPMIVNNPGGTFTIQKSPPKEAAKDAAKKGLVIPPQVVVPIIPAREKRK